MPTYTLLTTGAANGHQHVTLVDFPNDLAVVQAAGEALTDEHTSVAVGRGSGSEVEFLGVWDRSPDGTRQWTPEE